MVRTIAVVMLLAGVGLNVAHAETAPDWVLISILAGSSGAADVRVTISAPYSVDAADAFVTGSGIALDQQAHVFLDNPDRGDTAVATSNDLGGQAIDVVSSSNNDGSLSTGATIKHLAPAQTAFFLAFVAGGHLTAQPDVQSTAQTGDISVGLVSGKGSRVISLVDSGRAGPTVSVGSAGLGTSQAAVTESTGIVGAEDFVCERCTGSWTGPGTSGSWSASGEDTGLSARYTVTGAFTFAGPAGDWDWNWNGVTSGQGLLTHTGRPVLVAYVPLGSYWTSFAPGAPAGQAGSIAMRREQNYQGTRRLDAVRTWITEVAAGTAGGGPFTIQ